jgi:putative spermidine/putrescine transport system substrate-binding protein
LKRVIHPRTIESYLKGGNMADHELDEVLRRALEDEDLERGDELIERFLRGEPVTRRQLLRRGVAAGVGLTILSSPSVALAGRSGAGRIGKTPPKKGGEISFAELLKEAKKEKRLNTIALPPDWANYGQIMKTFSKKYGIPITNADPNASSAAENQAVKSLKGSSRAPDVLDVSPAIAAEGAAEGLYASYKNRNFGTVPRAMKDSRGFWVGDYWGVSAIGVNRNVVKTVPKNHADLLKSEYKGQVALNGDPRTSGSALAGVFAASIANGGSLNDIRPGIDYFARLKRAGNFILVDATPATVASGQTPITFDWDYLQLAYGLEFKKSGLKWSVVVPANGVYGAFYCQAINATGPHPFAARLWQEFLYSAQGQLLWLRGYSHPARFADLAKRKLIPKSLLNALPAPAAYAKVKFANPSQQAKAKAIVVQEWGPKVAGS